MGALLAAAAVSFMNYIKTSEGKFWFDKLKLKTPILKNIIIKVQTGRFARVLGSLIENGVPILNSLEIVSEVLNNQVFAREIKKVHQEVSKGKHISESLYGSAIFEKNTLDLISVGEQSGSLEEMLSRIAAMNETESAQQIEAFIFILEPLLLISLGVIIAFIVMAILLPILQMNFLIQ